MGEGVWIWREWGWWAVLRDMGLGKPEKVSRREGEWFR